MKMMKAPKVSKPARDLWHSLTKGALGDLTVSDLAVIEQLCVEYDLYLKAMKELEHGFTNIHGQVSPAVTVRNQALANMNKLRKEVAAITARIEKKKPIRTQLKAVKNF